VRFGHDTKYLHACRDNFVLEVTKHGMSKRDIVPNINFFMNVPIEPSGQMTIVDGLSLLTKADAGQVTLNVEPVRLEELVRDNFADTQILAEPTGVKVELETCDGTGIHGDRHRLRQLLLNLADNAIKYNQPQGRVTMKLRQKDDVAEFTIANTGAGIPSEILPRVFDRFFRGDPAHSQTDGCGLGLSIAKWIVDAHHGTIRIESTPSQWTTVTVRFPVPPSNPDRPPK